MIKVPLQNPRCMKLCDFLKEQGRLTYSQLRKKMGAVEADLAIKDLEIFQAEISVMHKMDLQIIINNTKEKIVERNSVQIDNEKPNITWLAWEDDNNG